MILHNEVPSNLRVYRSRCIVRGVKNRRLQWAEKGRNVDGKISLKS
jgi:hypothetical protein